MGCTASGPAASSGRSLQPRDPQSFPSFAPTGVRDCAGFVTIVPSVDDDNCPDVESAPEHLLPGEIASAPAWRTARRLTTLQPQPQSLSPLRPNPMGRLHKELEASRREVAELQKAWAEKEAELRQSLARRTEELAAAHTVEAR
eukprot:RCo005275